MKIFSRTLRLATVPMALAAAFPSLAQSDVPSAEKRLSETVITATRTATRVDEVVSDVVVVDRAAIEASTARTLSELLARNAGLQTTANGGLGKNSTLFIRGTESRHTILLIDGVRFGSATAGQPNYDNIPVDMIERVEVLKGPASALYGSEGVGGVVQVFTRRGAAGFAPYASATVGSNNHVTLATGASGGEGGLRYSFGVQKLREKGFSSTNSHLPGTSFNPDRDGFDQESLSGSISYQLTPDWSVSGNLLYADGEVQLDDGPNRDARTAIKTQVASLGLKGKITSDWQTELRASTSADKSASIVAASPNRFNTRQNELSWQNNVSTPIGVAVLGLEQREQKIESTTPYPVSERTITLRLRRPEWQPGWPQLASQRAARPQLTIRQRQHLLCRLCLPVHASLAGAGVAWHQLCRTVVQPAVLPELRQPLAAARAWPEHRCGCDLHPGRSPAETGAL